MVNALTLVAADVRPIDEARLLGSVSVRRGPIGDIAVGNDGATIAATNYGDNSVSMLNAATLRVEGTVPVDGEPFAVALSGGRAFVGASAPTYDFLSAIDARSAAILANLPVDFDVAAIAARQDGARLFVGGIAGDTVNLALIDVESGRVYTSVIAGEDSNVDAVRVSPNGRLVYVATSDSDSGTITVVDAGNATVVAKVPTSSPIRDIAVRHDGRVAYVLGSDPEYGGFVEIIDLVAKRGVGVAWIGGHPIQFALGADASRMYVVYRDRVAVLCLITGQVVDAITVGAEPSCVATSGTRLYIADYSGQVSVFSIPSGSPFEEVLEVETDVLPAPRILEAAV
jgi:YVTN family beta-propeller protein